MAEREKPRGQWYRQANSNSVVVFVHGINSNSDQCWRSASAYWPDLIAHDPEFSAMGIYLFAYRTNPWSADYSIDDAVDALEEFSIAHGLVHFKNVIFLCHSMGGIVARRFLVQNHERLQERRIRIGLFLVASPSRGSRFADWLAFLLRMVGQSQALALRTLNKNPWLNTLDHDFTDLLHSGKMDLLGKELLEDLPFVKKLRVFGAVVPPESGVGYFTNPVKVFGSDHFTIAAPDSRDDFQNIVLCTFLREVLSGSGSIDAADSPVGIVGGACTERAQIKSVALESLLTQSLEIERLFRAGATVKSFSLAKNLTQLLSLDLSANDRPSERWLRLRILSNAILLGIRSASYFPQQTQLLSFLVEEVERVAEQKLLLQSVVPEIVVELVAINQGIRNYRVAGELIDQVRLHTDDPVLLTKLRSRMFMADLTLRRSAETHRAILRENLGQADRKHDLRMPMMLAWEAMRTGKPTAARTILEETEQQLTKASQLYGPNVFDPMIQIEARLTLKSAIRQTEHARTEAETRNDDVLWALYHSSSREQSVTLRPNLWDLIGGFDVSASRSLVWEIQDLHGRYNQMALVDSESFNRLLEETTVRLVRILTRRYPL